MHKIAILGLGTLGNQQIIRWNDHGDQVKLILIDRDIVEKKNLAQQPLYKEEDIGIPKTIAIQKYVQNHNIELLTEDINEQTVNKIDADIVIDCTDNLRIRAIVAQHCWENNMPFIYGGAVGKEGMTCIFDKNTCHFSDVFNKKIDTENCQTAGIEVPTAKKVAEKQYDLAQQIVNDIFDKNMFLIDGTEVNELMLPTHTQSEIEITTTQNVVKICGTNIFQGNIAEAPAQKICNGQPFAKKDQHTIFPNGRVLVRAETIEEAKSILSAMH